MYSLKDAQGQTTEIVSASLIKTPPSDVDWSEYKDFDLGLDPEWQTDQCIEKCQLQECNFHLLEIS